MCASVPPLKSFACLPACSSDPCPITCMHAIAIHTILQPWWYWHAVLSWSLWSMQITVQLQSISKCCSRSSDAKVHLLRTSSALVSTRLLTCAGNVVEMKRDAGQTFSFEEIKAGVEQHKPAVLFLCQVHAHLYLLIARTCAC